VEKRVKELQTGTPNDLSVVATFISEYGSLLESTLHIAYQQHNIKNEWFYLTQEQVDGFLAECERTEQRLHLLQRNTYWNKDADDDILL
jgi:hypothetical protein